MVKDNTIDLFLMSGEGIAGQFWRDDNARRAVAFSPDQAVYAATELGGWHWAVKGANSCRWARQSWWDQNMQDLSRNP